MVGEGGGLLLDFILCLSFGWDDEDDGADEISCFRCPMISVFPFFPIFSYCLALSLSPALLGLLACLSRMGG